HDVLVIYFSYRDFRDMIFSNEEKHVVPLEEDAAYSIYLAFRDSCERLNPDAGWVFNQLWQMPKDYILERELKVLALPGELLDDNFSLLFVNTESAKSLPPRDKLVYWAGGRDGDWTPTPRDVIPCRNGLLIFRGSGPVRWR